MNKIPAPGEDEAFDEACRKEIREARTDLVKALKETGLFPTEWILERLGLKNDPTI